MLAHIHFIGIGGTGLSAIARVLLERGETVSGSDRTDSALAESIRAAGAQVYIGHAPEQVQGADVVVRSSAVPDANVEVVAAKAAGIPVLKRNDYLGSLLAEKFTIGIAGTHGKTTTTSMITWMLYELDQHPGFIVGGEVQNLGVNAAAGESDLFVIEADEYDHMFWGLHPTIAVVTNIEHDHPDCFPTERDMMAAFEGFIDRMTSDGSLVFCLDDPGAFHLMAYAGSEDHHWLAYSVDDPDADYTAHNLESVPGAGYRFEVLRGDKVVSEVALQVPGLHNVRNALAAIVTADLLNLDLQAAGRAISSFIGSGRRFEILGEAEGVTVIDDYGHHPTEIAATLQAARARFPENRIWAVWQPHTYSRTSMWQAQFGKSLEGADRAVVTGVYAAREVRPEDFSLEALAAAVNVPGVRAIEQLTDVTATLLEQVSRGDVVIVFSAGDATQVSRGLLDGLLAREASS